MGFHEGLPQDIHRLVGLLDVDRLGRQKEAQLRILGELGPGPCRQLPGEGLQGLNQGQGGKNQ